MTRFTRTEIAKRWRLRHPDKWDIYAKKQYANRKIRRHHNKLKVFSVLGGKCSMCSFTDWRALQVDHILGGGTKEHKARGRNGFDYLVDSDRIIAGFKASQYQLLCANCNWIKRFDNKESIGKPRRGIKELCH